MDKLKALLEAKRKTHVEDFGGQKFARAKDVEEIRLKRLREEEAAENARKVTSVQLPRIVKHSKYCLLVISPGRTDDLWLCCFHGVCTVFETDCSGYVQGKPRYCMLLDCCADFNGCVLLFI